MVSRVIPNGMDGYALLKKVQARYPGVVIEYNPPLMTFRNATPLEIISRIAQTQFASLKETLQNVNYRPIALAIVAITCIVVTSYLLQKLAKRVVSVYQKMAFANRLNQWANNHNNTGATAVAVDKIKKAYYSNSSELDLTGLNLNSLPEEIKELTKVKTLLLGNNNFSSFPQQVLAMHQLEALSLANNKLDLLPSEIGNLSSLTRLDISGNEIAVLPSEIGKLSSLYYLNASLNKLVAIPREIGNLSQLRRLFLADNKIAYLPSEIGRLISLMNLNLHNNLLSGLPEQIGNLPALQYLDLSKNILFHLIPEIGKLKALKEISIVDNPLSDLPAEMVSLSLDKIDMLHERYARPTAPPTTEQEIEEQVASSMYPDLHQYERYVASERHVATAGTFTTNYVDLYGENGDFLL